MSLPPFPISEVRPLHGQSCWMLRNGNAEFAVTQLGAHLADATFARDGGGRVSPYYVSPWQDEEPAVQPAPVLIPLRGDFFCLPFGGNGTPFGGERHPPHGETAGSPWTFVEARRDGAVTALTIELETRVRRGRVRREFSLVDGHNAIYGRTRIEGFTGPTPFAHHAILASPDAEGALRISARPFRLGLVCPHVFSDPVRQEYQALQPGAEFSDLTRVPAWRKDEADADCSTFPARRGFADLIATFNDATVSGAPDWVTAVNTEARWLWFAFKNPAIMPGRAYWMENRGRHGRPWNGRNACIGLEDGCMYFDAGLAESAGENLINRRGIPTVRVLSAGQPLEVLYVQGAIPVPDGFGRVADVRFEPSKVEFVDEFGRGISTPLRSAFVFDGQTQDA